MLSIYPTLISTCNVSIRIISRKRVQRQFLAGNCDESPQRESVCKRERERKKRESDIQAWYQKYLEKVLKKKLTKKIF